MTRPLNMDDIQGNIMRAYGRFNYPVARYFFLHINDKARGRELIGALRRKVTTAADFGPGTPEAKRPEVTLNVGITFYGLLHLGLPTRTLQRFPGAFIDGMRARAYLLGDRDPTEVHDTDGARWDAHWDGIWRRNRPGYAPADADVHLWISMNARVQPWTDQPVPALEEQTRWLEGLCQETLDGGVRILKGHGPDNDIGYQAATALFEEGPDGRKIPVAKEHFGYRDGIGDPVFAGQFPKDKEKTRVIGRGKRMGAKWEPLATGEFLLGHPDESQELPPAAPPPEFMQNGTFMVYRKLHQNVEAHRRCMDAEAERYARVMGVDLEEARETVGAKTVGRWKDGVPLAHAPTYADWRALQAKKGFDNPDPDERRKAYSAYFSSSEPSDFGYADDMAGARCPLGAHLRRANTRDYLDPLNRMDGANPDATTRLNKRRRILRRGLPYGPSDASAARDAGENGTIFMALCADIFRQFEFVQQQWIEYGLDFHTGNTTDPLIGRAGPGKRHVIQTDPKGDGVPYVMTELAEFVQTRGGEYFFLPSMTALRMIEMGVVDPT